jgi:hypothetical protein
MVWFKRKKVIPKDPLDTAKYQDPEWYSRMIEKELERLSLSDWTVLLLSYDSQEGK